MYVPHMHIAQNRQINLFISVLVIVFDYNILIALD